MEFDRSTDEDDKSDEEDWMDTDWDSVQTRTSRVKKADAPEQCGTQGLKNEGGNGRLMTRMQLNDHKAGMQGLDKQHINQIIYEASKGSRFFENERRKEQQVQLRIQEQEKQKRKVTEKELCKGMKEADTLIAQLKLSRDLTQTIVHVDMDAFYAAVAMRDNPSLRSKPMAVGGIGMLSTSNYEARKYGVRAAMPGFIGKKLCPNLVIVPSDFPTYTEVSRQVRQVFSDYDAHFCPMSLDEAYLNFTGHLRKRQRMSARERSVLKRCQTPADAARCCCDLNMIALNSYSKGDSSQSLESIDHDDCVVATNVNRDETENCEKHEKDDNDIMTKGDDGTLTQHKLDSLSGTGMKKTDSDVSKEQNKVSESEHGQEQELKGMPVEIGSQCPMCGKPIPVYEVMTFGLEIESAVQEMRCRIEQRTCLTASAGIAPNMMLAKVCSDQNKPNGQFCLPSNTEDIMCFVEKLPIRKISGIGRVTEQLLGALDVSTCGDLFEQRALLYHLYSPVSFSYFMRVACGIGSTQVASAREEERKSMSTEQTFSELSQPEDLHGKLRELCLSLANDLAREQLMGKTVSIKLKTTDFQVRTRAQTVSTYTNDAETIFLVAKGILRTEIQTEAPKLLRLRLMGVRMSKLVAEGECPQEKQDSILGFFQKSSTCSSPSLSSKPVDKNTGSHLTQIPMSTESKTSEMDTHIHDEPSMSEKEELYSEKQLSRSLEDSRCETEGNTDAKNLELVLSSAVHQTSTLQNLKNSASDSISNSAHGTNEANADKRDTSMSSHQYKTYDRTAVDAVQRFENETTCIQSESAVEKSPSTLLPVSGNSYSCQGPSTWTDFNQMEESPVCVENVLRLKSPVESVESSSDSCSFFSREPSFTCPICCKPVGCINLTDFNAHIDKCLQPCQVPEATPQATKPAKQSPTVRNNAASKRSKTSSVTTPSSLSSDLKKTTSNHCLQSISLFRDVPCSSDGIRSNSDAGAPSTDHPRKKNRDSQKNSSAQNAPTKSRDAGHTKVDFDSVKIALTGQSRNLLDESKHNAGKTSPADHRDPSPEQECADFMVCPLCSAERADWTLETFNQHVDTCLNRGTISQILEEQRCAEKQPRKRSGDLTMDDSKNPQQGKTAKKSQPVRTERSILSFFKT